MSLKWNRALEVLSLLVILMTPGERARAAQAAPASSGPPAAPAHPARAESSNAVAVLGEWRGTSLCTDRKIAPACKDETVRYSFTPASDGVAEHFHLKADKLVDGTFQLMGEMDFIYKPASHTWESEMKTQRVHGLWSFSIQGKHLSGTLIDLPSGALIRKVDTDRPSPRS